MLRASKRNFGGQFLELTTWPTARLRRSNACPRGSSEWIDFCGTLDTQEEREHKERDVQRLGGVIGKRFVPDLRREFEKERSWIERRLRENRERLADDFSLATLGDSVPQMADQVSLFGDEGDEDD